MNRKQSLTLVFLALIAFLVWLVSTRTDSASANLRSQQNSGNSELSSSKVSAVTRTAALASTTSVPIQKVLSYGAEAGELGMVRGTEMEPVGPESFAVGGDGNILVADGAKHRVAVYAPDGTYLRNIPVPNIALGDVTTDKSGRLYVYDQTGYALHQYDAAGTLRSTLDLNPKDIDTRGYFHVAGNAIYFADAAARDVLVAKIEGDTLTAPDPSTERKSDGIHAESGKVYSVALDREQGLRLQIQDPASANLTTLEAPFAGVVSARFVGEDESQRFYIQTERVEGSKVILEVLTFDSSGKQIGVKLLPENDYFIWTAKLVDVRRDGALVQFLPQRNQAKINWFAN